MSKKKYIAPAITVVKCSPANTLLAASAPAMKWDPEVNKEYRMDIYEGRSRTTRPPSGSRTRSRANPPMTHLSPS